MSSIFEIVVVSLLYWSSLNAQIATTEVSLPEQKFLLEPKDTSVRVGANVLLDCKVQDRRGVIQWTKDGFGLGYDLTLDDFPRYSIAGNEGEGNFSLRIEQVNIEDDGEFQCQVGAAERNKGIRSKVARLTVQISPSHPQIVPRSGVNTTAGTKVELTCEVHAGRPEPELSWIDGDGTVVKSKLEKKSWSPEGNKLTNVALKWTLTSASKQDGKLLKCEVKSPALDEKLVAQIPILVKYKPEVLLKVDATKINEFQDITFSCEVKAANPSKVYYKWYKNKEVINGAYTDTLTINEISRDYNKQDISCEIGNTVGITKQTHKLNVNYRPISSTEVTYEAVTLGGALKLVCDLDGNPKPTYSWTFAGVTLARDKEFKIAATTKEDSGTYTCKASVLGFPEATSNVVVLLNGPPNITKDMSQFAYDGDEIRVDCEIQSVPFPTSVVWSKGEKVFGVHVNDSYEIEQRNITNGVVNTLVIREPEDSDYGEYNCTAANSFGETSAVILLFKTKKFQILIILGGVIGGIVFVVTFTIAVIFCLRTKSVFNDDDHKTYTSKNRRAASLWSSESESTFRGIKGDISTSSTFSTSETDTETSSNIYTESYSQEDSPSDEQPDNIFDTEFSRYPRQQQLHTFPSRNLNLRSIAERELESPYFDYLPSGAEAQYDPRSPVRPNYLRNERQFYSTQGLFRTLDNYDLPNVTTLGEEYLTGRNLPKGHHATHV